MHLLWAVPVMLVFFYIVICIRRANRIKPRLR